MSRSKKSTKSETHHYVGWTSEGQSQLYQSLGDQGAFSPTSKINVIAAAPQTQSFESVAKAAGDAALEKLQLVTFYGPGTTGTVADKSIIAHEESGVVLDMQQASGYLAGQMLVKAVQADGADLTPQGAHDAIAGATFEAPQGSVSVRSEDHALLTPMFVFRLAPKSPGYALEITETFDADEVGYPAEKSMP